MGMKFFKHHGRQSRVPAVGRQRVFVDDRRCNARGRKRLAHFQTDKAAADDHDAFRAFFLKPSFNMDSIFQIAQRKNTGQIQPWHVRHNRGRAGGHNQNVIGYLTVILKFDDAFCRINASHMRLNLHLNAAFTEFFRRSGNQLALFLNYIPDVIGHRSGGKGDKFPLFQHRDIQGRIVSFRFSGSGTTARAAADNY
ncbi:MAG: hypothetical protein MZV70_38575 [Desulfobacterales bacterium]|nr:hypothetical protein [Desulfobacterales bacterium]